MKLKHKHKFNLNKKSSTWETGFGVSLLTLANKWLNSKFLPIDSPDFHYWNEQKIIIGECPICGWKFKAFTRAPFVVKKCSQCYNLYGYYRDGKILEIIMRMEFWHNIDGKRLWEYTPSSLTLTFLEISTEKSADEGDYAFWHPEIKKHLICVGSRYNEKAKVQKPGKSYIQEYNCEYDYKPLLTS